MLALPHGTHDTQVIHTTSWLMNQGRMLAAAYNVRPLSQSIANESYVPFLLSMTQKGLSAGLSKHMVRGTLDLVQQATLRAHQTLHLDRAMQQRSAFGSSQGSGQKRRLWQIPSAQPNKLTLNGLVLKLLVLTGWREG